MKVIPAEKDKPDKRGAVTIESQFFGGMSHLGFYVGGQEAVRRQSPAGRNVIDFMQAIQDWHCRCTELKRPDHAGHDESMLRAPGNSSHWHSATT